MTLDELAEKIKVMQAAGHGPLPVLGSAYGGLYPLDDLDADKYFTEPDDAPMRFVTLSFSETEHESDYEDEDDFGEDYSRDNLVVAPDFAGDEED